MKPFLSQRLALALLAAGFAVPAFMPCEIHARVLSGSVTERKVNRKISSMLKSARKSHDSGKIQPALDTYWKILEIDPNETFAYLELGEIYVKLKIFDRAIELLEPGLTLANREMDRDTICYYYCTLTEAYLELGKTGEANKSLIKAAEAAPKSPMPRKILGDIYLANNRIADAFKAYKKAVELDPDYLPAKEKLGELTATYGDQTHVKTRDKKAIAAKAVKLPATKPIAQQPDVPAKSAKSHETVTADNSMIKNSEDEDQSIIPMPSSATETNKKQLATVAEPEPQKDEPGGSKTDSSIERPRPVPAPVVPTVILADKTPDKAAAAAVDPIDADSSAVDEQIDKLLAGSPEDKKSAAAFLVKLEEKGLNEAEELLYDSDPEVRIIAIRILPEFKAFGPRVKSMLKDASEDSDPAVVEEIKRVLSDL